jgi:hypothetical protein
LQRIGQSCRLDGCDQRVELPGAGGNLDDVLFLFVTCLGGSAEEEAGGEREGCEDAEFFHALTLFVDVLATLCFRPDCSFWRFSGIKFTCV